MTPIINRICTAARRSERPYRATDPAWMPEAAQPVLLVASRAILPADEPEVTGPTWQMPALVLLGAALAAMAVVVGQLI